MHRLRTPFLFVSLVLFLIVLLIDLGSSSLLTLGEPSPPGRGIPALAFVDGLLLLQVGLLAFDALRAGRLARWINGPGVLVASIVVILASIVALFTALGLLILMVSVFMALPFGPAIYAAIWGGFERSTALGLLSTTLLLRIVAGVLLVLYDQAMLGKVRLLLLFFTCLVGDIIVSFLLAIVPGLLSAITDGIAAIVMAVVGLIWAIILLIPGAVGTLRLIRLRA